MTGLILRWRRERLQAGRQQRAQVQVVELLPCRGSGACIIVTIWPPELRSGHYDIEDKQQGTCACRQAAGRSTLALSLRMMENISIPVEEPLQNRLEFENAAVSQPGGIWRGTGTVAHCRNGYRIRGNHAFKSPIRFLIARDLPPFREGRLDVRAGTSPQTPQRWMQVSRNIVLSG